MGSAQRDWLRHTLLMSQRQATAIKEGEMRQPIEDDANRPAWDDAEPEPDDEHLWRRRDDSAEAVRAAAEERARQLAEEAYERAMTTPPGSEER